MSQPQGPYPYAPPPVQRKSNVWKWIVGAIVGVLVLCGGGAVGLFAASVNDAVQETETTAPVETMPPEVEPSVTPASPTATAPPVKKLTTAQEQAIGSAQDYLDSSHFSRKGLIEQLKYEGFTAADATYAVDYLKVDWNKQAVGAAKDYLASSHFSRRGLIEQLKYEGFTLTQAQYGVTGAGL